MADLDRRGVLLGSAGLVAGALPLTAVAQPPSDSARIGAAAYFRRQPLVIAVGAAAGGSYTAMAQVLANHLGRRLGTTVTLATQGSSGKALARLLSQPADGATIALVNAEAVLVRRLLVASSAQEPDSSGLQWLAGLSTASKVWFVAPASKLRTARDAAVARQLVWPAAARADTISDAIGILSAAAGIHSKVRIGFANAGEIAQAVIAGKADCGLLPAEAALPLVSGGKVHPLAVFSHTRLEPLGGVPTIAEALPIAADRRWLIDLRLGLAETGLALATAAPVPAYRVGYLRKSIADVLANPSFAKEAAASGLMPSPIGGEAMQRRIDTLLTRAGERIAELRKAASDVVM